jgi:hypothetical protein
LTPSRSRCSEYPRSASRNVRVSVAGRRAKRAIDCRIAVSTASISAVLQTRLEAFRSGIVLGRFSSQRRIMLQLVQVAVVRSKTVENGINLEVIWFDQDMVKVVVSCSNGHFSGRAEMARNFRAVWARCECRYCACLAPRRA